LSGQHRLVAELPGGRVDGLVVATFRPPEPVVAELERRVFPVRVRELT
jgi:hypothetical protein